MLYDATDKMNNSEMIEKYSRKSVSYGHRQLYSNNGDKTLEVKDFLC